jgi:exonuclease VII large subunit
MPHPVQRDIQGLQNKMQENNVQLRKDMQENKKQLREELANLKAEMVLARGAAIGESEDTIKELIKKSEADVQGNMLRNLSIVQSACQNKVTELEGEKSKRGLSR